MFLAVSSSKQDYLVLLNDTNKGFKRMVFQHISTTKHETVHFCKLELNWNGNPN